MTTNEIDRVLHEAIIANNAYPSPLNYMGFPKSVCTSVSNIIAHGIPDEYVLHMEPWDILRMWTRQRMGMLTFFVFPFMSSFFCRRPLKDGDIINIDITVTLDYIAETLLRPDVVIQLCPKKKCCYADSFPCFIGVP